MQKDDLVVLTSAGELRFSWGTICRLQASIGRTSSRVPCEMKIRGLPARRAGAIKPGENTMMCVNRSPLVRPSESA